VLKADGLAAGKGVCVTPDRAAAESFLTACLEGRRFGASGRAVLVEEFLSGPEISMMAVCDGQRHALLAPARDYKRAFDGDRGPNTGGMGAWAPVTDVTPELERAVAERIVAPTLAEMSRRGAEFSGVLYCGLVLTPDGPRVLEFNVRFGDPEAQVVLPLTGGSLATLLEGAARGRLREAPVRRAPGAVVAVALVDEGYPDEVKAGGRLEGLEELESDAVSVIHAGTTWLGDAWGIRGGRAAYVVGTGADRGTARARAYAAIDRLRGSGWRCRRDIAADGDAGGERAASVARSAGGRMS
jgi:phosphoribosylamine--glycine ligase